MDMQECDIMFCCKYCHTGKYQHERRNYQVFSRIYLIWESLITVRLEKITELKLMTSVVCILCKKNDLAYVLILIPFILGFQWYVQLYKSGMFFFTDFNYFPLKIVFPRVTGHGQNRSNDHFERGCRWFQLFFIDFSYFIF